MTAWADNICPLDNVRNGPRGQHCSCRLASPSLYAAI